jgi:hypothetical protein
MGNFPLGENIPRKAEDAIGKNTEDGRQKTEYFKRRERRERREKRDLFQSLCVPCALRVEIVTAAPVISCIPAASFPLPISLYTISI